MIHNITLVGLGAMGSYFAPRLYATYGNHFALLASGERAQRLKKQGIWVNGEQYIFPVVDSAMQAEDDLIIIAVKDTGLNQAIQDIRHRVGEKTQILCVMNGVESERIIAEVYGWEHVLYSFMRVSIVMKDYHVSYDPMVGTVHFGEKTNEVKSQRVKDIEEVFYRSNIPYRIDEDMIFALWHKFMANVGENMTCALLGIPYGVFRTNDHANHIRTEAMKEVVAIANHLGIMIGKKEMEYQDRLVTKIPFDNCPSTLQDIENQRKTEVEMFSGHVCELGRQYHIPTPMNELLYHGIKVLEDKYLSNICTK